MIVWIILFVFCMGILLFWSGRRLDQLVQKKFPQIIDDPEVLPGTGSLSDYLRYQIFMMPFRMRTIPIILTITGLLWMIGAPMLLIVFFFSSGG